MMEGPCWAAVRCALNPLAALSRGENYPQTSLLFYRPLCLCNLFIFQSTLEITLSPVRRVFLRLVTRAVEPKIICLCALFI